MKHLIAAALLWLSATSAFGQGWQVPSHALLVGRGVGVTGVNSVGPCTASQTIGWPSGVTGDPACITGGTNSPANPTGTIGLAIVNGSLATYMRSDASPALDQSIAPTWTGIHTFGEKLIVTATPTYNLATNVLAVGVIMPLNSATQTVAANKFFDFIRLSQTSGADTVFTVGDSAVATGIRSSLTSGSGSHSASNTYGGILHATNAGPGTAKGIHAACFGSGTSSGACIAVNAQIEPVATQGYSSAYFSSLTGAIDDIAIGYGLESSGARYALGYGNAVAAVSISSAYYRAWMATGSAANARAFQILNNAGSEIAYWAKDGTIVSTGMTSTGAIIDLTSITALSATAIPAGGTTGSGYKFTTTSNYGVFPGSGAPTLTAAKGSLYLRSDGAAGTRTYVNTDSSTTWATLLDSTALGTGVATFLATPSSANLAAAVTDETGTGLLVLNNNPTLIGATLTGTVAGGGNNLNNIIIGASTPLAGSFTTASASTSTTTPIVIGGSGVASTLEMRATSGIGAGNEFVSITGGSNGAVLIAKFGFGAGTGFPGGIGVGGATSPGVNGIAFAGDVSGANFTVNRSILSGTAGTPVNFSAGGATSGSTDKAGGNLVFTSGVATGAGSSSILFQAVAAGGAGTTDRTATTVATFDGAGVLVGATTDASSTSTGALRNPGGMSVNKRVWMNGLSAATGTPNSVCSNSSEITVNAALSCTVSSRDFKHDIQGMDTAMGLLQQIQPVSFSYNDIERQRWGFIAEDVAAVDRKLADGWDAQNHPRSIDQNAILAIAVKSLQELKADFDAYRAAHP